MATKRRNPPDATLRNVQSANRRIRELRVRVRDLEARVLQLEGGRVPKVRR